MEDPWVKRDEAVDQQVENVPVTYPFLIDHIPEEFRRKAEEELDETAENSIHRLEELKSLIKDEKALDGIDIHEDFLRQFLRHGKYDVQKVLKRFTSYVKFRSNNALYFENVESDKLSTIRDYTFASPLPLRCPDGCVLAFFELGKWHPDNIPVEDMIRLGLTIFHQSLRNPVTQINGLKMILDWKDCSPKQLKYMTPGTIYRSYQSLLNLTPVRVKEIHMVNGSVVLTFYWTLLKPFLSAKMKSRYLFHSSPEDILNYFPKHVLPVRLGGDLENYFMEDWMKEANEQQKVATLAGQSNIF